MRALNGKLSRVRASTWDAERFIVFHMVILQRARHVNVAQAIRRRIRKCLDVWEAGQHHILAKDTTCTCKEYLSTYRWDELEDHWENTLHVLVLMGKLQTALR